MENKVGDYMKELLVANIEGKKRYKKKVVWGNIKKGNETCRQQLNTEQMKKRLNDSWDGLDMFILWKKTWQVKVIYETKAQEKNYEINQLNFND